MAAATGYSLWQITANQADEGPLTYTLTDTRLTYVASYPIIFAADPISLISPNIGLIDPWGAIIGSILSGLFYAQYRRNISLFPLLDAMTPIFAVLTVSNGLVNLASGSGFGAESNLPWAIWLFGAHRHPTQIYEALAATAILAFLWRTWIKIPSPKSGVLSFTYIALTAGMRLFLEYFRADSIILTGGFRQAQLFAWLILASSLYALGRLRAPIK